MDFLDPNKERRYTFMLMIGYLFVGVGIFIATLILLYYAYGFGFGKNGEVVQNGLVFVSSSPNPANVYLNGKLYKAQTNTRAILQEGEYFMELKRAGYRSWTREVTVDGGKVVHYDYPLLIPTVLKANAEKTFEQAPTISLQSPDRRWLLAGRTDINQFEVLDSKNPKVVTNEIITIPAGILTSATTTQSWQLVEWSNDNKHVLLKHIFGVSSEYILLDRSAPESTLNLTKTLGVNPTSINLIDKKYDSYLLFDLAKQLLSKASLSTPSPVLFLDHVLAFKSYGTDTMLYVASSGPDGDGTVKVKLVQGDKSYNIRELPHSSTYLVDVTKYSGAMYVAAGASSEGKVYVYKEPIAQINDKDFSIAVPERLLRVDAPTYMAFSSNSRFLLVQGGTKFAVYDAEDNKGFSYAVKDSIDTPQINATWIDGHHLMYVSKGVAVIFDYDQHNRQELVTSRAELLPVFSGDYRYVYSYVTNKQDPTKISLETTPLRTLADQ